MKLDVITRVKRLSHDQKNSNKYNKNMRRLFPQLFQLESIQSHLRWMSKKRVLKQDILLLSSPPNTFARNVALTFTEINNLPVEFVSLTSDTTESDLKTRRDLENQCVKFTDQAPVRAALQGKVLILDGLEKCERNVLPTLNNLLENREMNLDDGRLLVSYERYQSLLKITPEEVLTQSGILPTHPNFFVIALTYPVPPYVGRTLDPPLRSRFQVRRLDFPSPGELISLGFNESVIKMCSTLNAASNSDHKLFPRIPDLNILILSKLLENYQGIDLLPVLKRTYPWIESDIKFHRKDAILKILEANQTNVLQSAIPKKISMNIKLQAEDKLPFNRLKVLENMLQDNEINRDILLCGPIGSGKSCKFDNKLK